MMRDDAYDRAMRHTEEQYAHIVGALRAEGVRAEVWQTGGMCMAIGAYVDDASADVPEEDRPHILLTCEEPLPHDRARVKFVGAPLGDEDRYNQWHLGLYADAEAEVSGEGKIFVLPYRFHDAGQDAEVARVVAGIVKAARGG